MLITFILFHKQKVLRLDLMTTVILTMTDNVVKGFNRLPEGSNIIIIIFFFNKCTSQSDSDIQGPS